MPGWAVEGMGGEIPLSDDRELAPNMAAAAWNVDLHSGRIDGLPQPELVADLSASSGAVKRAYRFPGPRPGVDQDVWLPLPSPYSSVVRSPLVNDTLHRVYWTNPPDASESGAYWSTYARIRDGLPPFRLGFLAPEAYWVPVAVASGGTPPTVVPFVARSYCFTYVDEFGLESSPSQPSAPASGASDATWIIYGLSNVPPTSYDPHKVYPAVKRIRLYRTVSGATGAQFYQVADYEIPPGVDPSTGYVDTMPDTEAVGSRMLDTAAWASPPDGLDGLVAMPGGMLVGFTGNTLHFCEPNRPHAWPAAFDLSVGFEIVGLGVWQAVLAILTKGFPSTGQGTSPGAFVVTQVQVSEPCISRGSIVTDMPGVCYASANGLVMLNYTGMQNQTLPLITRNQWQVEFSAGQLVACRHRGQYLALNGLGSGFILDNSNPRLGVVRLNTFSQAVSLWTDVHSGEAFIMANKRVYRWDSPNAPKLTCRWRSKRVVLPQPANMGACMVTLGPEIGNAGLATPPPLYNGDPLTVLPSGINALIRIYAGDSLDLVLEHTLTQAREVFRLPSGRMDYDWQWEVVTRVPVIRVALASTVHGLKAANAGAA